MKSFKFKDLMVNVAPAGERAAFCGFGSCHYGTYCGFFTPCGFTCDVGRTHPVTRTVFFEEQARVAAPAAQAGAGAGAALCPLHTVQPCLNFTGGCTITHNCHFYTCFGCTIAFTRGCDEGTFIACQQATCAGTCGFTGDPGTPVYQVDPQGIAVQLAAVRAQLQQELAAVEAQEKAVAEALRPQSAAEVEELQGKLRDAIAELDKQKQELQKKSSKK